jgi:hypothetical protein
MQVAVLELNSILGMLENGEAAARAQVIRQ